jgi:hypothetical protein
VAVDASAGKVLGGLREGDGSWTVVAMATGADGVTRPQTLVLP